MRGQVSRRAGRAGAPVVLAARNVSAAAKGLLLALAMLTGTVQANLLPDFYIFSDRPAPVPLALGSVLFNFYQDEHHATLVESLYVEQRFGVDMPGRDEMLLARGSAALGLGLIEPGKAWLRELDPSALPEDALPRMNLALARVAYLDGDDEVARQHVAELPASMLDDPKVAFLRAELLRRAGDLDGMRAALDDLPEGSTLWLFGWQNYAVACRAQNQTAEAQRVFEQLSRVRPKARSDRDIVLRAGMQSAMLRLDQGDRAGAVARLDRMPVAGQYGRLALAKRGELAMSEGDFRTAARVFTSLADAGAPWDEQRLSGLIGVPYVLEASGNGQGALDRYQQATLALEQRGASLAALESSVDDSADWLTALARLAEQREMGVVLRDVDTRFDGVDWLAWLSDRDTQRYLLSWKRLHEMGQRITVLKSNADALGEAAAEQERRVELAAKRLDVDGVTRRVRGSIGSLATMQQSLRALREPPLAVTDYHAWLMHLGDAQQRRLLSRLNVLRERARASGNAAQQRRAQRLFGVVSYELAANAPAKVWALESQRRQQQQRLEAVAQRMARIDHAESERRAQGGAAARVSGFAGAIGRLQQRADQLTALRATALVERLRDRIRRDRETTEKHLAFTRLAVARLTDSLMMARVGVRAGAPASTRGEESTP